MNLYRDRLIRLMRSRWTFLILGIFFIASMISYFLTRLYFADLTMQLSNPAPDFNVENAERILANGKALFYYFHFLYVSETHDLAVFALLAFVGIFLSGQYLTDLETGFGNFLMTRRTFQKYANEVFVAQSLYILFIVFAAYGLSFLSAFVMNGLRFGKVNIGVFEFGMWNGIGVQILQILILGIYLILINGLTLNLAAFIRKWYLLYGVPVVLFGLIPLVLTSTVAKMAPLIGSLLAPFIPFRMSKYISILFSNMDKIDVIVSIILVFFIMSALFFIVRKKSIATFIESYLP